MCVVCRMLWKKKPRGSVGLIITTGSACLTWRRRETGDGSTTQHCSTSTASAFILKVSALLVLKVLMLNEPVSQSIYQNCGSVTDTGTRAAQNQITTSPEGNMERTAPRWTVIPRRGSTFPVKTFTDASAKWLRFSCTESRHWKFCRTRTRLSCEGKTWDDREWNSFGDVQHDFLCLCWDCVHCRKLRLTENSDRLWFTWHISISEEEVS